MTLANQRTKREERKGKDQITRERERERVLTHRDISVATVVLETFRLQENVDKTNVTRVHSLQ